MSDLTSQSCKHYPADSLPLNIDQLSELIKKIPGWYISDNNRLLTKQFKFKNYYETIAFINAAAWIIHNENHHPELTATYNTCTLGFSTHTVKGLTLNDFICAAKINLLEN